MLLTSVSSACSPSGAGEGGRDPSCGKCDVIVDDDDGDELGLCVAIRGNGPRITAHFAALARILEHYGTIDGVAGGSSGSLSAFLLESVQMNPQVADCGTAACTPTESATRAAFLLKSVRGYFETLASTEEALALGTVAQIAGRVQAGGLEALLETDPEAAIAALQAILADPDLRNLVNPELAELLAQSPDPEFHARDLVASLSKGLAFDATDASIFVRPGAVAFPAFIDKLGRLGSFYAGYGPYAAAEMEELLTACATPSRGLAWEDAAALPLGGTTTCGDRFRALVAAYREQLLTPGASYPSRLDDRLGAHLPALVTTAVLEGDAVATWRTARADYRAARPIADFTIDYRDVKIGYWGAAADLALVESNPGGFTDLKTQKRTSLGVASWREALAFSPAEPGLSRALELPDGRVSVGGWSDLQPVLVLKNLGCERVIFLTREGGAGSFETGIAGLLGVTPEEATALWQLDDPSSSFYQAVEQSSGVWCADWDAPPVQDLAAMSSVGYDAPFETQDPYFAEGATPYAGIVARTGIPGCTLGVVP